MPPAMFQNIGHQKERFNDLKFKFLSLLQKTACFASLTQHFKHISKCVSWLLYSAYSIMYKRNKLGLD